MLSTATNFISKINPGFPEAGQLNASQGFRDNFKNISQALKSLDTDVSDLKITTVKLSTSTNFDNNLVQQAVFQDCSDILFDATNTVQLGDVTLDYSAGRYQKYKISSGTHRFSVTNWPGSGKYASMIVAISTASTSPTFVDFLASNVYNLSTAGIPSIVEQGKLKVYELWNDGDNTNLYVKEISSVVSNTDVNTTNVTATNISVNVGTVSSLTVTTFVIPPNVFTSATVTAESFSATVVKSSGLAGNLALHPNVISTTATNLLVLDNPLDTTATTFGVGSTDGIMIGSRFACTGTWTIFTVDNVTTNTVTINPPFITNGIHRPAPGETLKFINPRFADQPITLSFSTKNPSTETLKYSSGAIFMSPGDLKGQIWADATQIIVCHRDAQANPGNINALGWVHAFTLNGNHTGVKAVTGVNQFEGNVTFGTSSNVAVQNPLQSSSVGSGALVISGGVGIAKNCYIGGSTYVSGEIGSTLGIANQGPLSQVGLSSFQSTSTFSGHVFATSNFNVSGIASLTQINTATFIGTATFNASAIFNGPISFSNTATYTGNSSFSSITSATFTGGTVAFNTATTFNSTATFSTANATNGTFGVNILDGTGIYPTTNNGGSVGTSSNKYSAVYATNGTIQTSDRRLKDNIQTSSLGLNFINDLRPVSYSFRDSPNKTRWGLIAQEVKETIDRHNVDFAGWHLDYTGNPDSIQNLVYTEFIGPLIKAVQELSEQNKQLQDQIDQIKKNLK